MKAANILFWTEYLQIKTADLRSNMAKRIFFSLLPKLVPVQDSARISLTKGAVDYQVLRSLISGAKEIIEYGTQACLQEATRYYWKDKNLISRLKISENYPEVLSALSGVFADKEYWSELPESGGEPWKRISETLLSISDSLQQAQQARQEGRWEDEPKHLMEMVAYLNVLDGLAHNTGTVMDKMLSLEKERNPKIEYEKRDLERLMDSKELENYQDVIKEVLPLLPKQHQFAPDWISRARQESSQYNQDAEKVNQELAKIRNKKQLIQEYNQLHIPELQKTISEYLSLADNAFLSKILSPESRYNFHHLYIFGKHLIARRDLPLELRMKISPTMIKAAAMFSNGTNMAEDQWKEKIILASLPVLRKALQETLSLTEVIYNIIYS